MKTKNILLIFFLLSIIFHVLFFSKIKITLAKKQSPQINAWPNILKKEELSELPKIPNLPKEIDFSTDRTRKTYFSQVLSLSNHEYALNKDIDSYLEPKNELKQTEKGNDAIYFLWNGKTNNREKKQLTSYQAFVSPYGKIILFYPKELTLDSDKNIPGHNHLKESIYFFKKKFFWTKVDVLVK